MACVIDYCLDCKRTVMLDYNLLTEVISRCPLCNGENFRGAPKQKDNA